MKKENIEFLKKLVNTVTPTGLESLGTDVFREELKQYSTIEFEDFFNNIAAMRIERPCGKDQTKRIMISAHLDELSYMVSFIESDGKCRLVRCSGEDIKVLPGLQLEALPDNDQPPVKGVIAYKPIHVREKKEHEETTELKDLCVDFGCTNKQEVLDLGIRPGTRVVYAKGNEILEFGPSKEFIVAPGLDDKIGVYIIAEVMRRVKHLSDGVELWAVGMAQEETGLRGAKVAAHRVDPDISIDIDVTPVTGGSTGISEAEYGEVKFGQGVVIENGPGKDFGLIDDLIKVAKANNIPYQLGVCRAGGTNTAVIQENSFDCITTLLSIPNANMHQPNEMCHWTDVEACIELLVKWLETGEYSRID